MLYTGQILILIAILNNFLNVFLFFFLKKNSNFIKQIFITSSRLNALLILLAFLFLIFLYVSSDFRNLNVFFNSHSDKPLIYKISGVWGNHEGSLLLWILIMSVYNFVFSLNKSLDENLKNMTIFFQTIMTTSFILFMLLTSNPFIINFSNPNEGLGLNPVLQDPALAIHPPLLYIGYVGFSLVLSLAVSGMLTNKINTAWIKTTKQYSIFCWAMLTLGITVGSYWAYYELGWGGWWFWDPVENVSLMPWLTGLALIHSLQIINNNSYIKNWVIFLSILCFSLSLLGTFIVRSGVLMSVHAFASDSHRGMFILIIFFLITGFSFLVFLIKPDNTQRNPQSLVFNKYSTLIINNIVMTVACFTILLGTIYPIILESINNQRITVGAPYFNSTVIPIVLPGLLLMAIAPALSWKKNRINDFKYYLYIFFALLISCIVIYFLSNYNPWGIIGIAVGLWVLFPSIIQLIKIIVKKDIAKNKIPGLTSHIGMGILILGVTISSVWQKETINNLKIGEEILLENYSIKLKNVKEEVKNNYIRMMGNFKVFENNVEIGEIYSEKRYYPVSQTVTTEAGIMHKFDKDIYIVIGENISDNEWLIKIYFNPFVSFIWLGALITVLGGIISLRKI